MEADGVSYRVGGEGEGGVRRRKTGGLLLSNQYSFAATTELRGEQSYVSLSICYPNTGRFTILDTRQADNSNQYETGKLCGEDLGFLKVCMSGVVPSIVPFLYVPGISSNIRHN